MVALCGRCLVQHDDGTFHRKFNSRSVRNFRDDLRRQLSIEHNKQDPVTYRIMGLNCRESKEFKRLPIHTHYTTHWALVLDSTSPSESLHLPVNSCKLVPGEEFTLAYRHTALHGFRLAPSSTQFQLATRVHLQTAMAHEHVFAHGQSQSSPWLHT